MRIFLRAGRLRNVRDVSQNNAYRPYKLRQCNSLKSPQLLRRKRLNLLVLRVQSPGRTEVLQYQRPAVERARHGPDGPLVMQSGYNSRPERRLDGAIKQNP